MNHINSKMFETYKESDRNLWSMNVMDSNAYNTSLLLARVTPKANKRNNKYVITNQSKVQRVILIRKIYDPLSTSGNK